MFEIANTFSMQDESSSPYAWMLESEVSLDEIESYGVKPWVREYVKTAISVQNYSKASDQGVYKVWRSGWEFDQIVNYIEDRIQNT